MGNLDDFQRYSARLQRQFEKFDDLHNRDHPDVKRWVQKVDGDISNGSLAMYLSNLRSAGRRLDNPITELSEAEMDAFVYDLRHEHDLSQGSIRNIEFVIRKVLTDLELAAWAEEYELTPPEDNSLRPEDMLTGEDIATLTDHCNNMRDIALVEFLADTGARLAMVGTLRVRDVDLDGDKPTYRPNPNNDQRKGATVQDYPIIDSVGIMRSYLRHTHPRPDNPDVAFFHRLPGHGQPIDDDGCLSPQTIRQQIRTAADRAGIDKPVNPHNFRHSAITRMRREGYDRGEVEYRVHWTVDTDMWEVYEHISGEQHADAFFEQAGMADSDDGPRKERQECPSCFEPVAPHHQHCARCGEPLTKEAREQFKQFLSDVPEGSAAVGDQHRRAKRARLIDDATSHEDPSS